MKNKLLYIIPAVILAAVLAFGAVAADKLPFTDVPEEAWYYDTVVDAYEAGVMTGTTTTTFAPMKTMTRSEFVTLLYRITGVTETGFGKELSKFDDGVTDDWYSEAMGWGVKRGLIKGMDDNTVRPTKTITRAELAVMMVRYLEYRGITLPETAEPTKFTDDGKIADWCREQIYLCQSWGIFKGDAVGNFNPSNEASRAEGATIILRLLGSVESQVESEGIVIGRADEASPFKAVYKFGANGNDEEVSFTLQRIEYELGITFAKKPYMANGMSDAPFQLVFNVEGHPEIDAMKDEMGEDSYAVKVVRDGEYTRVLFASTSVFARSYAVEYLLTKYVKDGVLALPADLDLKGQAKAEDFLTIDESITKNCRDPFILNENGTYYAYVTGWRVYKTTDLGGTWTEVKNAVVKPDDYKTNNWAPEVHKYNGKYYMFTTYTPNVTLNPYENHGCIIMEASSPEGPFKMITDGWITPADWDCIDGTLYVDGDGQPWMVFVHEHTSLEGNGAMAAAKLSADFTEFTSEPIELFRAKDAWWSYGGITDGCFMYTTEDGDLLMLWSNNDKEGYALGVARSKSGTLQGEWTHEEPMIFTEKTIGFDGGHGMIFTAEDGQMYASFHSPNNWDSKDSKITLLPIIERNGKLVWDLNLD
ncbi:MAG: family 43 glycosylhydrolase [Clostridia bacterium]|nr:family 43 glycosylhydrolase [Clostridia bacterium]